MFRFKSLIYKILLICLVVETVLLVFLFTYFLTKDNEKQRYLIDGFHEILKEEVSKDKQLMDLSSSIEKKLNLMDKNVGEMNKNGIVVSVIIVLVLSIISITIMIIFIRKMIISPLNKAKHLLTNLRKGILHNDKIYTKSKDEVGEIIHLLNDLSFQLDNLVDTYNKISDGDLTIKAYMASDKDEVALTLTKTVGVLSNVVLQVKESIHQITEGSNQISSSAQSLSDGASKQASSLEEITASLTEISVQVQEHTELAKQVSNLTENTKLNADKGTMQMQELVEAMNEIDQSAKDIKNIVEIIDDIAFQTNLLALNADIEAARVGKYGKGFAVVANSVRALANKSQNSVKETTKMVELTLGKINRGVELVEITSRQLEEIKKESQKASDLAKESATSSQEQARGIEQINQGITSIEDVVQNNSASAEENASASEELSTQSQNLSELISYFKVKDNMLIDNDDSNTNQYGSGLALVD